MLENAFFTKDADNTNTYHPTTYARGPWDPNSLHGRVISGLIAYEIETNHRDAENPGSLQIVRITVDLFRLPPMAPLEVTSDIIRSGRRIKVIDVHITTEDPDRGRIEIARGSVIMLHKSQEPPGTIWSPPGWDVQVPDKTLDIPEPRDGRMPMWQTVNVGNSDGPKTAADNISHSKTASSNEQTIGARRAWIRETHNLIENEQPSPVVRVAQVADFANPFVNSGTEGLNYINADISLYLHRYPIGDWIGTDTFYHGADDGISLASIALYDATGKIGTSTVSGLAQIRS